MNAISNDKIVAMGKLENSLYRLQEEKIFSAQAGELCVHKWHTKLAHRNLNDIRKMQKNDLVIKECNCTEVCESCINGKTIPKEIEQEY